MLSLVTALNAFTARELADQRLLARVLSVMQRQSMVVPVLREVAGNGALLRLTSNRSYEHGNGFTKIVLARGDHWALRLHLHHGDASAAYHVHDHRWPFASLVMRGTLFEDRYETVEEEEDGEAEEGSVGRHASFACGSEARSAALPWLAFRYEVRGEASTGPGAAHPSKSSGLWGLRDGGGAGSFRATQVGRASMLPPTLLAHPPGTIYSHPAEQLHALPQGAREELWEHQRPFSTAPRAASRQGGGCATLVLTGTARDSACRLYSLPENIPREVTPKTPLPVTKLWALLLAEAEAEAGL